jgi:hypothetical protein
MEGLRVRVRESGSREDANEHEQAGEQELGRHMLASERVRE